MHQPAVLALLAAQVTLSVWAGRACQKEVASGARSWAIGLFKGSSVLKLSQIEILTADSVGLNESMT